MSWFIPSVISSSPNVYLICFHYAGGSAANYGSWAKWLPEDVGVLAVQLPGRDKRSNESFIVSFKLIVQHLIDAIDPYLDKPLIFFGHSLGALLSFELARELRRQKMLLPQHLIVSGMGAPQLATDIAQLQDLPDTQLIHELQKLNGIPEIILKDKELMEFYIPRLRADWALFSDYVYMGESALDCDITVLCGVDDPEVRKEKAIGWEEQTTAQFSCFFIPGDHFFINTSKERVLNIIKHIINESVVSI